MNSEKPSINIGVRCKFRDCHNCCLETQMILTKEDLERIQKAGYKKEEFCLPRSETDGYWQLKNIEKKCFFLNNDGKCTIYSIRPVGCRVYPLVYEPSEDDILIDEDCREAVWFSKQLYDEEQIDFVRKVGKTIISEKEDK